MNLNMGTKGPSFILLTSFQQQQNTEVRLMQNDVLSEFFILHYRYMSTFCALLLNNNNNKLIYQAHFFSFLTVIIEPFITISS